MPRCKNCKERFIAVKFNQKYCVKDECLTAFVNEVKLNGWKQRRKQMKESIKSRKDYLKEAQEVFNKYIRLRDDGMLCISCDKEPKKKNCGHYYSQGGHSNVRFDEENCHLQCEHCNTYLSGNLLNYQIGIQKRIGADRLIELGARAHDEKQWTIEELKDIKKKYQKKIQNLLDTE
jgi:hypothetical protein